MANENLKKWLAGGYVEAPDFLKELKNAVNEIDHLKETVRIYKVCDELAREHSKKVKHVFPLENTAGYGQLCDKVVEQQKEIERLNKQLENGVFYDVDIAPPKAKRTIEL